VRTLRAHFSCADVTVRALSAGASSLQHAHR
jgi:hypothetical protein